MKKILIATGVGFTEDEEFVKIALRLGCQVEFFTPFSRVPDAKILAEKWDIVLLRGLWTLSAEHALYVKILYNKMEDFLLQCLKEGSHAQVYGIGRGALLLLEHFTAGAWRNWQWEHQSLKEEPLCALELEWDKRKFQHLAMWNGWRCSGYKDSLPESTDFCKFEDYTLGWKIRNAYISLPDIFSAHSRSQQDDFGYAKAQEISLGTLLWKEILKK